VSARTDDLPRRLADIVEEFAEFDKQGRLELLLEFSNGLPALPERYAEHPDLLEPVPECQSPIFVATEIERAASSVDQADATVRVFFRAPREAPTTRGFAGILAEGLDGLTVRELTSVPDDVAWRLGLDEAVSPLRLRGMVGMLARIKRQAGERAAS
jgi:cysteine desulfuration protein SufE